MLLVLLQDKKARKKEVKPSNESFLAVPAQSGEAKQILSLCLRLWNSPDLCKEEGFKGKTNMRCFLRGKL